MCTARTCARGWRGHHAESSSTFMAEVPATRHTEQVKSKKGSAEAESQKVNNTARTKQPHQN